MNKYLNAFSELWDNTLVPIPSGPKELLGPLEREFILRRFNIDQMGMEHPKEGDSPMQRVIGAGMRIYKPTGEIRPVVDFYYSYFKKMSQVFQYTPIVKYFGLSIKDALAMPVNQWYEIEKEAKRIAERQPPDSESRMLELMKQFMEMMTIRSVE